MLRRIPWKDVFKFLAGAFFVSAGVHPYLYFVQVSVPLGSFVVTPEVNGCGRSSSTTLVQIAFESG